MRPQLHAWQLTNDGIRDRMLAFLGCGEMAAEKSGFAARRIWEAAGPLYLRGKQMVDEYVRRAQKTQPDGDVADS